MLVTFWSPFSGKSAVSGSILATAMSVAVDYKIRCSLLQVGYEFNELFSYFMPVEKDVAGQIFENTGIDALLRSARGRTISSEEVTDCSFSFVERRLNVFNPTTMGVESVFLSNLEQSLKGVTKSLNDTFRINFVDVPAGANRYAELVIGLTDVLVVCLPQSKSSIEKYLEQYNFNGAKVLYVFGDYDEQRSLSMFNTAITFPKSIKFGSTGCIPHCTAYANELDNGRAISFYLSNTHCGQNDENYSFIKETRKVAGKVLKLCNVERDVQ